MEYIKEHPSADRLGLVCFFLVLREVEFSPPPQLRGIAEGLNYLHSRHVVHGDLKGVRRFRQYYPNLLTDVLAKHSCRQYRPCMPRGLWSCHRNSGPGTHHTDS